MTEEALQQREFSVSVPADPRHLKTIRAFFHSVLEETFSEDVEMLVLALDESCSNVLKHQSARGESTPLTVRARLDSREVRFVVCDYCCQEEVSQIRPRDLDEVRPGGLGTHFIGRIMDRVRFEADAEAPGRMSLVLEKSLPTAGDVHG